MSPTLSLESKQQAGSLNDLSNESKQEEVESHDQSVCTDNKDDVSEQSKRICRTSRTRILCAVAIIMTLLAIIIPVVVAVVIGCIQKIKTFSTENNNSYFLIVRKPSVIVTDYYSGFITVNARFDTALISPTSMLSNNYRREFCSLVS